MPTSRVPASISLALSSEVKTVFLEQTAEIVDNDFALSVLLDQVQRAKLGITNTAGSGSNGSQQTGSITNPSNPANVSSPTSTGNTAQAAQGHNPVVTINSGDGVVMSAMVRR